MTSCLAEKTFCTVKIQKNKVTVISTYANARAPPHTQTHMATVIYDYVKSLKFYLPAKGANLRKALKQFSVSCFKFIY